MVEKKDHRYNSCAKKIPYPNWQEAEEVCLKVMDEGERELVLAYKCKYQANHWHVGHHLNVAKSQLWSISRSKRAILGRPLDK